MNNGNEGGNTIGSLTLVDILVLVVLWFGTSMVANLLWTRFVVLKYVGRAFMGWINGLKDDKEGQESMYALLDLTLAYMGSRQIKTGNKVKVASDKLDAEDHPIYIEQDEVLTPIDLIARHIGNYAIMKMKGQAGGVKSQLNKVLQEGLAGEGAMPLSPAALKALSKGQLGPALTEALLPELMKRLSTVKGNDTTGGAKW